MELRHGTVVDERGLSPTGSAAEWRRGSIDEHDGLPVRVRDRGGAVQLELAWEGHTLISLATAGAVVSGAVISHPLLGDAHVIETAAGVPVTVMSAIDWARPTEIPTVAAPARVPPGAGSAILNAIAWLAARAGVPALRYAGPYPTPALWRTLARSFRTAGADADEAAFTDNVIDRALHLARDPIAIDFAPAPFERIALGDSGWVELRDGEPEMERASGRSQAGLVRAVLGGVTYDRDGSPARLVAIADGAAAWSAELWFGDGPWAHVARLAADGALVDGPHAIMPMTSSVLGREFPPNLRAALADLVADAVPPLLAHDARALLAARPIVWADLGARAARTTLAEAGAPSGFAVHAALWERIAPLGLPRLALALAEALAPVVTSTLLAAIVSRRE